MTQVNFADTNNKLLKKIEALSTDYQQLVLDFVDFLSQKQQKNLIILLVVSRLGRGNETQQYSSTH